MRLHNLYSIFIRVRHAFVSTDFSVLPLPLFHQSLQFRVVVLSNCLWFHLDDAISTSPLDVFSDINNCSLQSFNAYGLLQTRTRENV